MRAAACWYIVGSMIATVVVVGAKAEPDYPAVSATVPLPRVAEGAPDPKTKKLLDELGSENWRVREQASRQLAALGEQALPHLRKALLESDDPEVRQRLSVLVRQMERAFLIEPKRITLNAKDQTCKQILEAIAQQTGYRLEFQAFGPHGEAKYSFEFQNTPFWQAVDTVANAAGLSMFAEYEDNVIRFYPQETISPYVAYSGPFRFTATNISVNRNVQLAGINRRGEGQRANEHMNLSFQINSEPKNPMLGITQPELTEAKDDLGGNLLQPQTRNAYYPGYYNSGFRGHSTHMNVNLSRGDRRATLIKSLKGRVGIILLAGATPEIVVTEPLKVEKKTFRSRTVELELESVTEDTNQKGNYTVALKVSRVPPPGASHRGEDWNWGNSIWQKLELLDTQGQRYYCHGPTTQNNNGTGTVQLVVQFGPEDRRTGRGPKKALTAPAKLILHEWLTVTQVVAFEFQDIPLP